MQSLLVEKAVTVIANPQILINVISRRVRQLACGHRPLVEANPRMGLSDIALTEVIEGKLTYETTTGFKPEPGVPQIADFSLFSAPKKRAA